MAITNYGGIYNYNSGGGSGGSGGSTIGSGSGVLILLDASTGSFDYTLPAVKYKTNYIVVEYNIIKTDNSSNTITIKSPPGATFKNGTTSTSYILKNQNETVRIVPDSLTSYRRI